MIYVYIQSILEDPHLIFIFLQISIPASHALCSCCSTMKSKCSEYLAVLLLLLFQICTQYIYRVIITNAHNPLLSSVSFFKSRLHLAYIFMAIEK
ncbi:hypothetical protein GDO78_012190 [Eleutherodactylus coqui]|uniref:Uncharacterized protein n=1 Tax=Eleutherodactylus coqui TaxID=57060 RepID=A0A8J6F5P2_ELECQ|nr:hypothetical protein GDO78_012190 [Eleutherodactylus coqui]